MLRQFLSSDLLQAVGYDPETEILELEFIDGYVRRYACVPPVIYLGLMISGSVRMYLAIFIEGRFPEVTPRSNMFLSSNLLHLP